jgi:hypothetical protein
MRLINDSNDDMQKESCAFSVPYLHASFPVEEELEDGRVDIRR